VHLTDIDPPNGYRISGEGQGGAAGFAKGGANVALADEGADTLLTYQVNAQVGGKLAQLGGRLIDASAKQMADQFFDRFSRQVQAMSSGSSASAAAPPADLQGPVISVWSLIPCELFGFRSPRIGARCPSLWCRYTGKHVFAAARFPNGVADTAKLLAGSLHRRRLATTALALMMQRPLFLEGEPAPARPRFRCSRG
jgi:hypothetical protein